MILNESNGDSVSIFRKYASLWLMILSLKVFSLQISARSSAKRFEDRNLREIILRTVWMETWNMSLSYKGLNPCFKCICTINWSLRIFGTDFLSFLESIYCLNRNRFSGINVFGVYNVIRVIKIYHFGLARSFLSWILLLSTLGRNARSRRLSNALPSLSCLQQYCQKCSLIILYL